MDILPVELIKHEIYKYLDYKSVGRLYQTHKNFWLLSLEMYNYYKRIGLRAKLEPDMFTKKTKKYIYSEDKLEWLNRSISKEKFFEFLKMTGSWCRNGCQLYDPVEIFTSKKITSFKINQVYENKYYYGHPDYCMVLCMEISPCRPNVTDNTKLKKVKNFELRPYTIKKDVLFDYLIQLDK